MSTNIVNFEEKRKEFRAKPYLETGLVMGDISGILDDLEFFKKNVALIEKSDNIFMFSMRKYQSYSKSVIIQREFIEKFDEIS